MPVLVSNRAKKWLSSHQGSSGRSALSSSSHLPLWQNVNFSMTLPELSSARLQRTIPIPASSICTSHASHIIMAKVRPSTVANWIICSLRQQRSIDRQTGSFRRKSRCIQPVHLLLQLVCSYFPSHLSTPDANDTGKDATACPVTTKRTTAAMNTITTTPFTTMFPRLRSRRTNLFPSGVYSSVQRHALSNIASSLHAFAWISLEVTDSTKQLRVHIRPLAVDK